MDSNAPLVKLLSSLINVPNVEIQSRVNGEVVGFVGPIVGIHVGVNSDPFIQVDVQNGRRFYVSLDDVKIHINRSDKRKDVAETQTSLSNLCLVVRDGRACRKVRGHTSPHDWEVYPLGSPVL